MLDIKFVRMNPDVVKENIKKKFQDEKLPLVDEVLELFIELGADDDQLEFPVVYCSALNGTASLSSDPADQEENMEALSRGMSNLYKHIENLKGKFGLNVIVAINKYTHDTTKEIEFLTEKLKEKNIELSLVESWEKGGEGAIDLAEKVIKLTQKDFEFNYAYKLNLTIKEKIETIAKKIYGADGVEYVEGIEEKIAEIERMGYGNLPICIAKTQYSLSDDQKNLECNEPFNIHIQNVILKAGAEFIVIITGKIMTMPGLPKVPAAESIDVDNNGNIVGIF